MKGRAPRKPIGRFQPPGFVCATKRIDLGTNLILPTLDPGLAWDTSDLLTSGALSVVAVSLVGDLNHGGFVDIADLNIVLGHWNPDSPPTHNANIPEPASLGLLSLNGLAQLRRR